MLTSDHIVYFFPLLTFTISVLIYCAPCTNALLLIFDLLTVKMNALSEWRLAKLWPNMPSRAEPHSYVYCFAWWALLVELIRIILDDMVKGYKLSHGLRSLCMITENFMKPCALWYVLHRDFCSTRILVHIVTSMENRRCIFMCKLISPYTYYTICIEKGKILFSMAQA